MLSAFLEAQPLLILLQTNFNQQLNVDSEMGQPARFFNKEDCDSLRCAAGDSQQSSNKSDQQIIALCFSETCNQ